MRTSYSAIKLWERCPQAWAYRYIDKLPDKAGAAAQRGTRIHAAGERYLKGEIPIENLPVAYKPFLGSLELAKRLGANAEAVWVCGKDWKTHYEENDTSWIKSIVDMSYIVGDELHIVDFKTGRDYPEHTQQLELYMIMGAARFPTVKSVHAACWYLDKGEEGHNAYYKQDWLKLLRRPWEERVEVIAADKKHPATPSIPNCKWCAFGKSKGGPCHMEFTDA